MSVPNPRNDSQRLDSAGVASLWAIIHQLLECERKRIHEEIKTYPRPIPACDAQFNYLLEQRAGLDAELSRLEEARQHAESFEAIQQFLRSSPYIADESKQRLSTFPSAGASVN
jgi:hypothetical protein